MESNEAEVAVEILDQRRAVLDPIPAVHVYHVPDLTDLRSVDVPADDSGHAALATELEHGVLVVGHVLHRALRAQLDVRRERPVAEPEAPADPVDPDVQVENLVVEDRPHALEQPVEVHQAVELMPVNDEILLPVGARVHRPLDQAHRAERDAEELFQKLVVIPGDERDVRVLAVLAQQLLDERVVLVVPEPSFAKLPPVNEIAHDVEVGGFGIAEKLEQFADLGVLRAQVNVGYPDRAIVHNGRHRSQDEPHDIMTTGIALRH